MARIPVRRTVVSSGPDPAAEAPPNVRAVAPAPPEPEAPVARGLGGPRPVVRFGRLLAAVMGSRRPVVASMDADGERHVAGLLPWRAPNPSPVLVPVAYSAFASATPQLAEVNYVDRPDWWWMTWPTAGQGFEVPRIPQPTNRPEPAPFHPRRRPIRRRLPVTAEEGM